MVRDGRLGQVLAGRYRLEAPVGMGASGRVYAAHDLRLDRSVAVKILDDSLAADPIFVERFHREVLTASQLTHPHVVRVFDWGDEPGPYLVTELVGGGSLAALLARGVRLSPEQATRMGHDVAEALAAAHAQGIVHRDVKPANLLFDERGDVRLADFGLARAMASASPTARRDAVFGTLRYAAPEQVGRDGADPRSDLYALALVLVESVTGAVPFDADDPARLIAARREQPIPVPAALGPLAEVIDRVGRVRPDDRLPDAATMARMLAQAARRLPDPEPIPVGSVLVGLADPYPTELAPRGYETGAAAGMGWDFDRSPAGRFAAGDAAGPLADRGDGRRSDERSPGRGRSRRGGSGARGRRGSGDGGGRSVDGRLVDGRLVDGRSVDGRRSGGRRRRGLLERALAPMLVSLLVVVAALVVLVATSSSGSGSDEARPLPNTVGGSVVAARLALENAGVDPASPEILSQFSHEKEGTVVGQQPAAGLPISGETLVTLLVSAGPEMTAVPELGPVDEATVRSTISGARLAVGTIVNEHNEFLGVGQLISQNPAAGMALEVGSVVDLVFSLGPMPRTVPALANMTVDEARAAIVAADLVLSEPPGQEYSDTVEIGRVVRQDLVPGSLTDRGHLVNVMVSLGPELVVVPQLAGLTVEEATSRLRALGLEVGTAFNYSPGGQVLQSDPTPGTELPKGTEVDLFIRR